MVRYGSLQALLISASGYARGCSASGRIAAAHMRSRLQSLSRVSQVASRRSRRRRFRARHPPIRSRRENVIGLQLGYLASYVFLFASALQRGKSWTGSGSSNGRTHGHGSSCSFVCLALWPRSRKPSLGLRQSQFRRLDSPGPQSFMHSGSLSLHGASSPHGYCSRAPI